MPNSFIPLPLFDVSLADGNGGSGTAVATQWDLFSQNAVPFGKRLNVSYTSFFGAIRSGIYCCAIRAGTYYSIVCLTFDTSLTGVFIGESYQSSETNYRAARYSCNQTTTLSGKEIRWCTITLACTEIDEAMPVYESESDAKQAFVEFTPIPMIDVANLSGIFVGSTEIQKVILNGATIYQKAAAGFQVSVQQSPMSAPSGDTDTEVYDGQDNTGTLLGTIASDDYTSHTYTVTSGFIAIVNGTPENKGTTSGGVSYVGPFDDYGWYYSVTADGSITDFKFICLTGDSLVTMADGTQKRLDEIEIGDSVLSFDWETKDLIARKVIFTDKDENKSFTEFDRWIFADGTEIKTVHRHEFYNVEKGGMAYMDTWKIGDHAYRIDGSKIALVGHENVKETVKHYKITLEGDTNYFVHGLLNGDRNCPKEKL